ncbi:MAG: hypothetical protein ACI9MC_000309 [Kiritimatiellia bacterium]|jgi:hypothetical protein
MIRSITLLALGLLSGCAALQRPDVLQLCAIDATTMRYLTSARIREGRERRARPVESASSCRTMRKVVGSADEPRNPKLDQTVHFHVWAPGYLPRHMHYRVHKKRNTVVVGLRRSYTLDSPGSDELMIKTFIHRDAPPCPDDCNGCIRTPSSLQLTGSCYVKHQNRWIGETASADFGTDTIIDKPFIEWPTTRLPYCRHGIDQVHRCKKRK